jgi:hypothetical protein
MKPVFLRFAALKRHSFHGRFAADETKVPRFARNDNGEEGSSTSSGENSWRGRRSG